MITGRGPGAPGMTPGLEFTRGLAGTTSLIAASMLARLTRGASGRWPGRGWTARLRRLR